MNYSVIGRKEKMPRIAQTVLNLIDESQNELINLAGELVQIPTEKQRNDRCRKRVSALFSGPLE